MDRRLLNEYGNFIKMIPQETAVRLEREGKIRRVNRKTYKIVAPPEAVHKPKRPMQLG